MKTRHRDEGFRCERCGIDVPPLGRGTCRNHCPACLTSRHVDAEVPGDRLASCGGLMTAISARSDARRGIVVVHRCDRCGAERVNRIADARPGVRMPDSMEAVWALMQRVAEGREERRRRSHQAREPQRKRWHKGDQRQCRQEQQNEDDRGTVETDDRAAEAKAGDE